MSGRRRIDWSEMVESCILAGPATATPVDAVPVTVTPVPVRPTAKASLEHAMGGGHHHHPPPPPGHGSTTRDFFNHSDAHRINTDAVISRSLKEHYPNLELVVAPASNCNLLAYADAGLASYEPVEDDAVGGGKEKSKGKLPSSLRWDIYLPPARRLDGALGVLAESVLFGKFLYKWRDADFLVYLIDGRDGGMSYPTVRNYYILAADPAKARELLLEAGRWGADLHDEIWVFDGGAWSKNRELYASVQKASWDDVILDAGMKKALIDDHLSFFGSRDTYARLRVPWKRGIIYYGPPGNGKTVSIKATMHMLYDLDEAVPTLYVRSLASYGGPEYAIKQIFRKAREFAPCYLVFEDLDSLIDDRVRSYFLNEVDGLKNNDGIFMVGSTNHLDRLDPGIAKRPSRFDRKYYFPDPDFAQRVAYCRFWQGKLADNETVEFPDALCTAVAEITDKFSFAYMQEAFVAALLAIAQKAKESKLASSASLSSERRDDADDGDDGGWHEELATATYELEDDWVGVVGGDDDDGLKHLVLWVEIKKQIKILREGMEDEKRTLRA